MESNTFVTPMNNNVALNNEYAEEMKQLEALGFARPMQNLRLLRKTKGNVEVVKNFLEAKKKLQLASVAEKHFKIDHKEKKCKRKLEKLQRKREHETLTSSSDESDDQEKLEKKQKKLERVQMKLKMKEEKIAAKLAKKELKKASKEVKKKEDKHVKVKNETDMPSLEELPQEIRYVYLDGNNMLFVLSALRKHAIKRRMPHAEALLEGMARQWVATSPNLKQVTLIFDDTTTFKAEDRFTVCSARPQFATSDHALVAWIQLLSPEERAQVAVFTSDRALSEDLLKNGAKVFKPKMCFNLIKKATSANQKDSNLDDWADNWVVNNFDKINLH